MYSAVPWVVNARLHFRRTARSSIPIPVPSLSTFNCQLLTSFLATSQSSNPPTCKRGFSLTSVFSHSSKLFCTTQNCNSFVFKQIRTLSQKHPGGGYPPASLNKEQNETPNCKLRFVFSTLQPSRHRR